MSSVGLLVNGVIYGGWKRIAVTRTMESLAGSFELTAVDRWADQGVPWPIVEEDQCTVLLDGVAILLGWVDRRELHFDVGSHEFSVSGRDFSGALADCSAQLTSWTFRNVPVLQIAQQLAAPFGVSVSLDPSAAGATVSVTKGKRGRTAGAGSNGKRSGLKIPSAPKRISVAPGESAFTVLDRLCRNAGLVPMSNGLGGIVLTRAGATEATGAIIQGQNVKAASASYDASQRYGTVVVVGQHAGSNQLNGRSAAAVKQSATDPGVQRPGRILFVRAEGSITPDSARVRAAWEVGVRRARGQRVEVTLQGWTQPDGSLWPVNGLVDVDLPALGAQGVMLITAVTSSVSDGEGLVTRLSLSSPGAFVPETQVIPDTTSGIWKQFAHGVG